MWGPGFVLVLVCALNLRPPFPVPLTQMRNEMEAENPLLARDQL